MQVKQGDIIVLYLLQENFSNTYNLKRKVNNYDV